MTRSSASSIGEQRAAEVGWLGTSRSPGWTTRFQGPWFALIWAPVLLVGPVVDAAAAGRVAQISFMLLIGASFVVVVCLPSLVPGVRLQHPWLGEATVAFLMAECTLFFFESRGGEAFIFPLLSIASAIAVRPRWALSVISALTISGAVEAGLTHGSVSAAMTLGFSTFFAGVAVYLVQYLILLVIELERTRGELATTAVAEERLRFSRDLHDLLGHTLSVIVVKAEAIRRTLGFDQQAAAQHAEDIETIGRRALAEVRRAATGYRSTSLRDELTNARQALLADDIDCEVMGPMSPLDVKTDSLLGWVVREATTNVLRHSGASFCRIRVTRSETLAQVEVADNGAGSFRSVSAGASASVVVGSGLRGLRERVEEVGGELTFGATADGFRLLASIPEPTLPGNR